MIRSIETIIDQMRAELESSNSELANFPNFGNLYSIFRAVGSTIIEQDVALDTLNSNLFLTTATGDSLDAKANEFNIQRKLGTPSAGGIICLGSSINIPPNTILTDPKTGLQFSVTERIIIGGTRGVGSIKCTEFTSSGNLRPGVELLSSVFSNIKFIVGNSYDPFTSSYKGGLVGGSSREEDAELKTRILTTLNSLSLSTLDAIELAALNINGITKVSVVENEPSLGYITVYINNSQTNTIKLVEQQLNLVKPVGVALQVKTFNNILIDVNLSISTFSNTNTSLLNNSIVDAIQTYINSLNQGDTITRESLAGSILKLGSVNNVNILTPASNILIKSNEVASLNNINISYI